MSYKQDIERIAEDVKVLIQADIKAKGLVDTGRLLNSIEPRVKLNSDNSFEMDFYAEDYFKYVDGRYDIIKDVTSSAQFKQIEDRLLDATVKMYEEELDKIFNKNKHLR